MQKISALESLYTSIVWKRSPTRLPTLATCSRAADTRTTLIRISSVVDTTWRM